VVVARQAEGSSRPSTSARHVKQCHRPAAPGPAGSAAGSSAVLALACWRGSSPPTPS
jgi:hypothetical protein